MRDGTPGCIVVILLFMAAVVVLSVAWEIGKVIAVWKFIFG